MPLDATSRALHWIIGFAIIGMIPFGLYLEGVRDDDRKAELFVVHSGIGLTILVLALVRLRRRLARGIPAPIPTHKPWERRLARPVHWILLAATVLAPLTGILFAIGLGYPIGLFGLFTVYDGEPIKSLADVVHVLHGPVLVLLVGGLIVLHVLGALKHHFVDRDDTLKRMVSGD